MKSVRFRWKRLVIGRSKIGVLAGDVVGGAIFDKKLGRVGSDGSTVVIFGRLYASFLGVDVLLGVNTSLLVLMIGAAGEVCHLTTRGESDRVGDLKAGHN